MEQIEPLAARIPYFVNIGNHEVSFQRIEKKKKNNFFKKYIIKYYISLG